MVKRDGVQLPHDLGSISSYVCVVAVVVVPVGILSVYVCVLA